MPPPRPDRAPPPPGLRGWGLAGGCCSPHRARRAEPGRAGPGAGRPATAASPDGFIFLSPSLLFIFYLFFILFSGSGFTICSDWQAFQRAGSGAARLRASLLRSLGLQPPAGLGLCFGPMNPSALGAERGKKKIKNPPTNKKKRESQNQTLAAPWAPLQVVSRGLPSRSSNLCFLGKRGAITAAPKTSEPGGVAAGPGPPPFCRGAAGSTAPARRGGRAGSRSVPAGRCRAPRGVPRGGF